MVCILLITPGTKNSFDIPESSFLAKLNYIKSGCI